MDDNDEKEDKTEEVVDNIVNKEDKPKRKKAKRMKDKDKKKSIKNNDKKESKKSKTNKKEDKNKKKQENKNDSNEKGSKEIDKDKESKHQEKKNKKAKQKESRENKKDKKQEKNKNKDKENNKEKNKKDETEKKAKRAKKKDKSKKEKVKKEKKKLSKKSKIIIIVSIIAVLVLIVTIALFLVLRPKFKDVTLELGTQEINVETFLVSKIYKNGALAVTNLSEIDLTKVGQTDVTLSYKGKEQTVKLTIQDTTPPEVVQDLTKGLNYKINVEDFIVSKKDLSKIEVEIIEQPEITEYADYKVKISVKDEYGNETIGECNLKITWLIPEVTIEIGQSFSLSNLVLDVDEFGDRIPQSEIDKIDESVIGEYTITVVYDDIEYTSKIKVQDTTPPELELKNISIYEDEKISNYKQFIVSASDASGDPETTLKTDINYSIIGNQDIVIEAVDKNGNKVEKTATLTIKRDNIGPTIYGLGDKTVAKNSTVDYRSGVWTTDDRDGNCDFTVDSSAVNTGVAGTYYATYTSKDKKGNTTTRKRKIIVKHNQEDTNNKFNQFYNNYLAGKDIVGMASAIRTHIAYSSSWGGDDPVWYGLTEGRGNCYVHANIMQRALTKAGYQSKLIYLTDTSHYWNLVKTNKGWRHIDATPSVNHTLGLLTDEQKLADVGLHGKTWDRASWPKAE